MRTSSIWIGVATLIAACTAWPRGRQAEAPPRAPPRTRPEAPDADLLPYEPTGLCPAGRAGPSCRGTAATRPTKRIGPSPARTSHGFIVARDRRTRTAEQVHDSRKAPPI